MNYGCLHSCCKQKQIVPQIFVTVSELVDNLCSGKRNIQNRQIKDIPRHKCKILETSIHRLLYQI